jgi:2-polyprenyl-3-methyl-5-hydroxy-6-metoxy-1,4-benzoquinol methylase
MAEEIQEAYTHVRDEIIAFVPSGAKSILDVGCSNGATGRELKGQDPSVRVVGLDISEAGVSKARSVYDAAYVCDLNLPDALSILGEEVFEVIIVPDVLEHLVDPSEALRSLTKHLSPKGVIVVSLPNIQHWSGLLTIAGGRFPREPAGLFDGTHLRWFTRREAENLFSDCGLDVMARAHNLRLSRTRRGKPLFPLLRMAPSYFSMQMIFQLRRGATAN